VWNTLSKREFRKIEKVFMRRATGMVLEYQGLEYEYRLKRLGYAYMEMKKKNAIIYNNNNNYII